MITETQNHEITELCDAELDQVTGGTDMTFKDFCIGLYETGRYVKGTVEGAVQEGWDAVKKLV